MNMASSYRADNPASMYVKNRPRRRNRKHPMKGMKNVKRFTILKRAGKTAVLLIAPETGRLPEDMGSLARYISGKSGGLGEVVSALSEGLRARGINCHLA